MKETTEHWKKKRDALKRMYLKAKTNNEEIIIGDKIELLSSCIRDIEKIEDYYYYTAHKGKEIDPIGETRRIRWSNFMVHIDVTTYPLGNKLISYRVYPIEDWVKPNSNETGFHYLNNNDIEDAASEFTDGKCVMKLEGTFYKNEEIQTWEGRLGFTCDEYWDNELETLSGLYNYDIVPWCREFLENNL